MDIGQLAGTVVGILHPYLGVLVNAGVGALGKDVWQGVKDIWTKLGPKVAGDPELKTAAHDLAADPDEPDNVAAFRKAVRKILEREPELAQSLHSVCQTISSGRDTYVGNVIRGSSNAHIGPNETQGHAGGSRRKG